jgi:hypothetical protein
MYFCLSLTLNRQTKIDYRNLFGRKSKKEKLEKEYAKKLEEAHRMSSINRKKADDLIFQAEQLLKEMENEN